MRIAIFAESFLPKCDGVAASVCYMLDYLAARGHASMVFAPKGAPPRYAETPVIGLSSFAFPLYPEVRLVPPVLSVEQHLTAFRPDLIYLANPVLLGLIGLRHASELRLPLVASYQTDIPGYATLYGLRLFRDPLWLYFRWLMNRADLTVCPSGYTKRQLETHGFKRVKVMGHGVDTERFNPRYYSDAWRQRLSDGHPDAPLLLYVGRLAPEKRVHWLRSLLVAIPGVRLAIVGDGPARPELEETFRGTPTVFTGYLRGNDLSSAYASADIFTFPSTSETFGLVVLEAMASGLPVIAPDAGGQVDFVTNGRNGFLFGPDSREEMISLTRWLVEQPAYRRQLGAGALAYAQTQSWEAIMDSLMQDFEMLTQQYTPRRSMWWLTGRRLLSRSRYNARHRAS